MSFTLSTSAAILAHAGLNNPMMGNVNSAAIMSKFSDEAEGDINAKTHYDWVANYSTVGANFKPILDLAVASFAGNMVINYDMSGYTSRTEAQTMLDVNSDIYASAINELKDSSTRSLMGGN